MVLHVLPKHLNCFVDLFLSQQLVSVGIDIVFGGDLQRVPRGYPPRPRSPRFSEQSGLGAQIGEVLVDGNRLVGPGLSLLQIDTVCETPRSSLIPGLPRKTTQTPKLLSLRLSVTTSLVLTSIVKEG